MDLKCCYEPPTKTSTRCQLGLVMLPFCPLQVECVKHYCLHFLGKEG